MILISILFSREYQKQKYGIIFIKKTFSKRYLYFWIDILVKVDKGKKIKYALNNCCKKYLWNWWKTLKKTYQFSLS